MDEIIGNKLKEFSKKYKISIVKIAADTGIPKDRMYKWARGSKPSNIKDYKALINYMRKVENIPIDSIVEEEAVEYGIRPKIVLQAILLRQQEQNEQYKGNAVPGEIIKIKDEPALIIELLNISDFGLVGKIGMTGDMMLPPFRKALIAVKKVEQLNLIKWEEYHYVIDKNLDGVLKKVVKGDSEDSIKLLPENSDTDTSSPVILKWNELEAVFKVKGWLTKS